MGCVGPRTIHRGFPRFALFAQGELCRTTQIFVEDDSVGRTAPICIERVSGDDPDIGPSHLAIQLLCDLSPFRIQGQQGEPSGSGAGLQGVHERPPDPLLATTTMHDQFGHIGAMKLVRSPRRMELACANNPLIVARHEKRGLGMAFGQGIASPFFCAREGQGSQKTHGCSRINRVY